MTIDFDDPGVQAQLVANHYRQMRPFLSPDHPAVEELYTLNRVLSDGKLYTCTWSLKDRSIEEVRELSEAQMDKWEKELS